MECPICGRNVKRLVKAEIEGAVIEVCEECGRKYGKIVSFESAIPKPRIKKSKALIEIEDLVLVDDYGEKIMERRKQLGMSREELAKLLHEKESVIKRIENEEMIPDEKLLKKLEKALGIKLTTKEASFRIQERKIPRLTLGDVVELR